MLYINSFNKKSLALKYVIYLTNMIISISSLVNYIAREQKAYNKILKSNPSSQNNIQ